MKYTLLTWMVSALLWAILPPLMGQVSPWSDLKISSDLSWDDRSELPDSYRSLSLNVDQLSTQLASAPLESSKSQTPLEIALPMPEGNVQFFSIQESPIMEPGLAAKFPQIRTYSGKGIDDPTAVLRITDTPHGIRCMILSSEGVILVEPASRRQAQPYLSYRASDLPVDPHIQEICGTVADGVHSQQRAVPQTIGEELLTYRIAVTSSSTYTQWTGGTVGDAISEITSVISQVNVAMERDLAIRLILVTNNDLLIFLPNQADLFTTNPDSAAANLQTNHNFITSTIGSSAFDIGHVFIRIGNQTGGYVAGIAQPFSVCSNNSKGRGSSTSPNPGNFGFVETVAHEIGHQFSARHSFNSILSGCEGNRTGSHAYEPGSGSTIMSYSSCSNDNIPGGSLFYYHADAQESIINFTRNGQGNNCPAITPLNNQSPVVDAGIVSGIIPISTPFELTGAVASDPDGDALTYCWEQFDLGPAGPINSPSGNAPIFRSFFPVPTPERVFPRLSNLVSNLQVKGELLPTYDRDLTFRLTVRDQNGGVASDELAFEVTDNAGPFELLYPSDPNITVTAGYPMEIEWDVAFTNFSPVNCSHVDIYLSEDGGQTFPHVLETNVPNIGSKTIIIPDIATSLARIKVKASNNIFFDLSNRNFTIELPAAAGFDVFPDRDTIVLCGINDKSIPIYSVSLLQFSEEIGMTIHNLPSGVVGSLVSDSIAPGDTAFFQIATTDTLTPGVYPVVILAFSPSGASDGITLFLQISDPITLDPVPALSPSSQLGLEPTPSLSWASIPEASSYHLELASNPGFGASTIVEISGLTDTSYTLVTPLVEETPYYWRVRGENPCSNGPFSLTQGFQTGLCARSLSTDVPLSIPVSNAPNSVSSILSSSLSGTIRSLKVVDVSGTHEAIDDVEMTLTSPAGTTVTLFSGICGNIDVNFDLDFSDDGEENIACAATITGLYQPVGSLSDFYGENAFGTWTLTVTDTENSAGGLVTDWGLDICQEGGVGPVLVKNLPLNTNQWFQETIPTSLLQSVFPGNSTDELVYTIVSLPVHGGLLLNGSDLALGDQFSQEDIDQSRIAYLNNGDSAESDSFRFDIVNAFGNWVGVYTYHINIAKGTTSIDDQFQQIHLSAFPNPTDGHVGIDIQGEVRGTFTLKLINLQGKTMWEETSEMRGAAWHRTLDLTSMPTGLYLLNLSSRGSILSTKLIVE